MLGVSHDSGSITAKRLHRWSAIEQVFAKIIVPATRRIIYSSVDAVYGRRTAGSSVKTQISKNGVCPNGDESDILLYRALAHRVSDVPLK